MITDIKQIDPFSLPSVSLEEIDKLPKVSGIYFAILEAKILYIGKSVNLHRRWHQRKHQRNAQLEALGNVIIAWLSLLEPEEGDLEKLEEVCIKHFKPSLNSTYIARKPVTHELRMSFGKKLRQFRREKGVTQQDLAEASGLSGRQISNIEIGLFAVSLDSIERLAEALEIPTRDFFS